uniref:Serpin family G member 1 n=1 Tax=Pelusios castaneus TaxID=367368 RepID=A0A8C8VM13_9SAUR
MEGQETQQGVVQTGPGGEELGKEPDEVQGKELAEEQGKELTKECDKDPGTELAKEHGKDLDKEPGEVQGKELAKEEGKDLDKEPDEVQGKELAKEQGKDLDKEPGEVQGKELAKEEGKDLDKEPDEVQGKELAKEQDKEPTKEPTLAPTSEATTTPTPSPQRCPPSNPWATCGADFREEGPRVATALTDFSLKFYSTVAKVKGTSTNVVFSPLSVALALSHLLLGARGETKERLESILSYPPDLACFHAPLKQLVKSKALSIASNLFYRKDLQVNKDFLNQSLRFYDSRPHMLSGNESYDLWFINKWVREVTHGKIKKLLKELEPDVQLVLLNAIYFQSKWKTTFKVRNTVDEKFYRPGQAPIQVPMMTSKKYPLAFFTDQSLQAKVGRLQLSHNMSLVVIVPQRLSQTLSEVVQKLTKETFAAVMKKLMESPFKPTVVTLPKLKLDSSQDLMDILGEMDYGIFYYSNLCGISEAEDLVVTSAQHRAVLELNEEGVEAAAATAFSVARTAWLFDVQQPFLFVLWNDDFSFPIFMGHVNDPSV